MSTIYTPGTSGPWSTDDELVSADGVHVGALYVAGVVTCDGIAGIVDGESTVQPFRRRVNRDVIVGRVFRDNESHGPRSR